MYTKMVDMNKEFEHLLKENINLFRNYCLSKINSNEKKGHDKFNVINFKLNIVSTMC